MASRHQQRGGEAVAGKQHKLGMAGGTNRQALGDIGNLLNGKPVVGNRPMTRGLKAQLLLNGQEADETTHLVKMAKLDLDRNAAAKAKQKAPAKPMLPVRKTNAVSLCGKQTLNVEKKATTKLEQHEKILEIQPGISSRKKVNTLTAVLTARSKKACGITDKQKDIITIPECDALDKDNHLAVVEYVEDLYVFYKSAENSCRIHDYMGSQIEINAKMRAILTDWLIEVHKKFELAPETLYLTIYIIDRFLSMETVLRRELQLVGVTAMLIACKYEEIWSPEVNDFMCISERAYNREQILAKEKGILNQLQWNLTVPTPYVFLVRFLKVAMSDKEMENMVFFFAELGLVQYSVIITYRPSMFAASAVYAARYTLKKKPLWNEALHRHTGFSEPELMECAKLLISFHASAAENKLRVVYNKYSSPRRGAVALHSPATLLLFEHLKKSVPAQSPVEKGTTASHS